LTSTKKLDESLVYPDGLKERMHPQLVDELINQKTSLGKHPFSQIVTKTLLNKIMGKRFNEVAKRYMGAHDVRTINPDKVISECRWLDLEWQ
jgi:hypothetical protein